MTKSWCCFILLSLKFDYPVSYSNGDTSLNAWNRHSDPWPVTVTSHPIRLSQNFITIILCLILTNGFYEKKEEILPSPMTKAITPAEMSKGQSDSTNNVTKKFDYTAVADRPRTVTWSIFATDVACPQGTLILPDKWFRPPFWTCLCSYYWDQIFRTYRVCSWLIMH